MKTTTIQSQPIHPTPFQTAARIESSDAPQGLNREPSLNRIEFPTSKSQAAESRKTTFRLEAPSAHSVKLAADFTGWEKSPLKMIKQSKGVWQTTVPLVPGHYSYRFIVDGQWHDDPLCPHQEKNPFGTTNAVLVVT
jgi:1,4-alpha-glucan branching enzyme